VTDTTERELKCREDRGCLHTKAWRSGCVTGEGAGEERSIPRKLIQIPGVQFLSSGNVAVHNLMAGGTDPYCGSGFLGGGRLRGSENPVNG